MNPLHAIGAFLAGLIHLVLILAIVGAALYFGAPMIVRWGLDQHSQLVLAKAGVQASGAALSSDTANTTRTRADCERAAGSSYRAGLAVSRLAAPHATPTGDGIIHHDEIANVIGPPGGAP